MILINSASSNIIVSFSQLHKGDRQDSASNPKNPPSVKFEYQNQKEFGMLHLSSVVRSRDLVLDLAAGPFPAATAALA
jgi:hypothetical protein